jgi:phage terminase small subunit
MFTSENATEYQKRAVYNVRSTLKQKKLAQELPKNGWNVSLSAKKAGYSIMNAEKNTKDLIEAPGLKKCLEELGLTDEYLQKEYKKIIQQDDDYTNKRLSIDRITDIKHPELKAQNNAGTTNNIQIIGSDIAGKMLELQAELKRLEALE